MYVYVSGSIRGSEGKEYYLFPGQYEIKDGIGAVLIYNISTEPMIITADTLLTRSLERDSASLGKILNSFSVTVHDDQMDDLVHYNPALNEGTCLNLND